MSWLITGTQKVNCDPSLISTALWLDAADASTITESGGVVSQWNDKSGNLRHASQGNAANQPTYSLNLLNSKNVVSFTNISNASDFLTLGVSSRFSTHRLLAIVYQDTFTGLYSTPVGTVYSATGSYHGGTSAAQIFRERTPDGVLALTSPETLNGQNFRNGSNIGDGTTTARPSTVAIQTHVSRGPFPSGQLVSTIGADSADSTNRSINGYIAELIILTYPDIDGVRQRLEGYLAHKWGLTANLPSDHPYKVNVPTP
jgi:hypothetical protein